MNSEKSNLIWIDLETTGINADTHLILEIATVVTDWNLNIISEGPNIAISQNTMALNRMGAWCEKTHRLSGLLTRVFNSDTTLGTAEAETLDFLKKYCGHRLSPLCGNSVDFDRLFLERHMPHLSDFLHCRNIDVSTVKELMNRWYAKPLNLPPKSCQHLALSDIRESITEMRFYQEHYFA